MPSIRHLDIATLNPPLNPVLITNVAQLPLLSDFFSRVKLFGFDTETNIVKELVHRKIRTIQIGNKDEQYIIDLLPFAGSTDALINGQGFKSPAAWAKPIVDTLKQGLDSEDHVKVGHFLQFDYTVCLWCLGLYAWNLYDTYRVEQVIQGGLVNKYEKDFWALDDLLLRYTGLRIDKTLQKSFDLESPLSTEQIQYCALDTRLPLAVKARQEVALKKYGLERAAQIENNAIPAFGDIQVNGMKLDPHRWIDIIEEVEGQHAANVKVLDTFFIPVVGSKKENEPHFDLEGLEAAWKDEEDAEQRKLNRKAYQAAVRETKAYHKAVVEMEGDAYINYGSPAQLLQALRKLGYNARDLPNTGDKVLQRHSQNPVIKALQNYRETQKILSTYGRSFIDNITNETGRVHSYIDQLGAGTGRTSSKDPNLQNIPKHKKWRACFVAQKGYKLITVDQAGAELRILAELSQSKTWLEAFRNGWDLHSVGAQMMKPAAWEDGCEEGCQFLTNKGKCKCKEHNKIRDGAKTINFGIPYGMEDAALADKLGISRAEAKELLKLWREINKEVDHYLEQSGKNASLTMVSRTLSGRWRRFKKPDWNKAKELAQTRAKEDGKDPATVTYDNIKRAFKGMFSRIAREGKNTPIQGGNADIIKESMSTGRDKNGSQYLWHKLREWGAMLVNMVHDELVIECPEEHAEECAALVGDCYRRAGAEFMKSVVMESEASVADHWTK